MEKSAPLAEWMPPRKWKLGAHSKHLRNLYVYFWRWATWKVYDHGPGSKTRIACFISAAGFLSGPGSKKCATTCAALVTTYGSSIARPRGHQPDVNTRIFQGVQQPICIVLASRSAASRAEVAATVRFQALPIGRREEKFAALAKVTLGGKEWVECPVEWRAPFLPASTGAWARFPKLEELFVWNGAGVQTKRTWVMAPDVPTLVNRWNKLIAAPRTRRRRFFTRRCAAANRLIVTFVQSFAKAFQDMCRT